jgi:flagellar basal-body rod modification protein FlgD
MTLTANSTAPTKTLGKEEFLKLLITQLRYQDPLNPMEGTEFAAQLAQFSSVERLQNIEEGLSESLDANRLLSQSITNSLAATMIGKDVRVAAGTFTYGGTDAVKLGFTLTASAASSTVQVLDSAGTVVRTLANPGRDEGDNTFSWDGKDSLGNPVAAGTYTFKVSAVDADGKDLTAKSYLFGMIEGVRFRSDGTYFVIDGVEVPISEVQEVLGE